MHFYTADREAFASRRLTERGGKVSATFTKLNAPIWVEVEDYSYVNNSNLNLSTEKMYVTLEKMFQRSHVNALLNLNSLKTLSTPAHWLRVLHSKAGINIQLRMLGKFEF